MSWAKPSYSTGEPGDPWGYKQSLELEDHKSNYVIHHLEDSHFGRLVRKRQATGRDFQAILTSMGGNRGLGKTTLAVIMGREFDLNGWDESKGYLNVFNYMRDYMTNSIPGDVFVQDETEIAADKRRAMAGSNVKLSQVIAACRFREVSSIFTLPTRHMLDDRIFGLCTFWIHVVERGTAAVFYIMQNDFTGDVYTVPLRGPGGDQEFIYFADVSEYPEKRALDQRKQEFLEEFVQGELMGGNSDKISKSDIKGVEQKMRDGIIRSFDRHEDLSQGEIARKVEEILVDSEPEHIDPSCSQQHVSKVLRGVA